MRAFSRMACMILLASPSGGCYAYHEVDRATLSAGTNIRVTMDRAEAIRQVEVLGGLRDHVEGRVQEQTDGAHLALTVRHAATPAEAGLFNTFVSMPWGNVTLVEEKRFSPLRTAAVAAGAGVVTALTLSVLEGSSKPGGNEQPSVNDAIRIPLIRFSW